MYFAAHERLDRLVVCRHLAIARHHLLGHFLWLNMGFVSFRPTHTENYLFVLPIKCSHCLFAGLWFAFG